MRIGLTELDAGSRACRLRKKFSIDATFYQLNVADASEGAVILGRDVLRRDADGALPVDGSASTDRSRGRWS